MEKYAHLFLKHLTKVLEFVIAALLACAIIIMTVQLAFSMEHITDISTYPNYEDLLTSCFNLIIGVELIRMLYLHTPITVFEVLLFAIARQIIIDHTSPLTACLVLLPSLFCLPREDSSSPPLMRRIRRSSVPHRRFTRSTACSIWISQAATKTTPFWMSCCIRCTRTAQRSAPGHVSTSLISDCASPRCGKEKSHVSK